MNIKLGWNCTSNDFIPALNDAEYFVMAFTNTLSRFYITFASVTKYQIGDPNIKRGWNWASNDFIDTLNDAEHFLRSFLNTLGRFYITFATVSEYQNEYQNGYPNIKLGWNCTPNDFVYTLNEAEHFLMSFPTSLSRFYVTFATMTEYQNGNPNIKLG